MESPNPLDAVAHLPLSEQADVLMSRFALAGSETQVIVFRLALRLVRATIPAPTLHDLAVTSDQITTRLHRLMGQLDIIRQLNDPARATHPPLLFLQGRSVQADPMQNPLYAAARSLDAAALTSLLDAAGLANLPESERAAAQTEARELARAIVEDRPHPHLN